jgi:hypothetical protein
LVSADRRCGVIKTTSALYILSLITQKPEPPAITFSRPKRKPRLKPGKSINVSAEEKALYEALINSQDANYEGIIIADRRKV